MSDLSRAADLIIEMEEDVRAVAQWGRVISTLAYFEGSIDADDLIVVGRALKDLGASLRGRWELAFLAMHRVGTSEAGVAGPAPAPADL